jgi:hypothetical protein
LGGCWGLAGSAKNWLCRLLDYRGRPDLGLGGTRLDGCGSDNSGGALLDRRQRGLEIGSLANRLGLDGRQDTTLRGRANGNCLGIAKRIIDGDTLRNGGLDSCDL